MHCRSAPCRADAGGVPAHPGAREYGTRYALTLYVCVAILAVLFVPETELALFYVLVMGYYPCCASS